MWSFLVWLLVIWSYILSLDQIGYLSWSVLVGSLKFDHLSFEKIVVTKFFGCLVIYLSFCMSEIWTSCSSLIFLCLPFTTRKLHGTDVGSDPLESSWYSQLIEC